MPLYIIKGEIPTISKPPIEFWQLSPCSSSPAKTIPKRIWTCVRFSKTAKIINRKSKDRRIRVTCILFWNLSQRRIKTNYMNHHIAAMWAEFKTCMTAKAITDPYPKENSTHFQKIKILLQPITNFYSKKNRLNYVTATKSNARTISSSRRSRR